MHGLGQAKTSGYSPSHIVGDSVIVLSLRRMKHPPRNPHQTLLFLEARVLADDIGVYSWGYHYLAYNKMVDRIANIAMDTNASIQEHGSSEANVVEAATAFLDNDVNYWLETSIKDPKDP